MTKSLEVLSMTYYMHFDVRLMTRSVTTMFISKLMKINEYLLDTDAYAWLTILIFCAYIVYDSTRSQCSSGFSSQITSVVSYLYYLCA